MIRSLGARLDALHVLLPMIEAAADVPSASFSTPTPPGRTQGGGDPSGAEAWVLNPLSAQWAVDKPMQSVRREEADATCCW